MSTARCYLDPIRSRKNLHIETGALARSLVLDGKRCTGVRYSVGNEQPNENWGGRRRVLHRSRPRRGEEMSPRR